MCVWPLLEVLDPICRTYEQNDSARAHAYTCMDVHLCTMRCILGSFCLPPLMGLAATVSDQACICLEELCALDTVVLAEPGEIFARLHFLEGFEVLRREHVFLDLVQVPVSHHIAS